MTVSGPLLSIALVTRNRPESLARTLQSLRSQSVQPWEVVVSDDSDDTFVDEAKEITQKYGCRYLRGPQRGLYANRNHAALACTGTHIRTMDDDHEFPEGHFKACFDALLGDPVSIWIIGEIYPGQSNKIVLDCPGQLHPRGFSTLPPDTQNCWAIADGASIYPRAIFDACILFADDYKFGASYLEFGSRLYHLGFRIRHLATTYIIHYYDPYARSFMALDIDLSSRFFAMLCHAFLYQPDLSNKILCLLEICKQIILHREIAIQSLRAGKAGFARRKVLLSPTSGKVHITDGHLHEN